MITAVQRMVWIIVTSAGLSASFGSFGGEGIQAQGGSERQETAPNGIVRASFERGRRIVAHPEAEWGAGVGPSGISLSSNANTDKVLHAMAASGDPDTRIRALEASAQLPGLQALELLLGGLEDTEPEVRETAIRGLISGRSAATEEGEDLIFRRVLRTMSGPAGTAQACLDAAMPDLGPILGEAMLEAV